MAEIIGFSFGALGALFFLWTVVNGARPGAAAAEAYVVL